MSVGPDIDVSCNQSEPARAMIAILLPDRLSRQPVNRWGPREPAVGTPQPDAPERRHTKYANLATDGFRVGCPFSQKRPFLIRFGLAWISHRGGCIGPGNMGSSFSHKGLIDSDVGPMQTECIAGQR
jgi:hypothetical protein